MVLVVWAAEERPMIARKLVLGTALSIVMFTAGVFAAQDISPRRHPNLAAAQRLVDQALGRIDAAQQANEFDMRGHAAHAKELLDQANRELKEAAEAANRR